MHREKGTSVSLPLGADKMLREVKALSTGMWWELDFGPEVSQSHRRDEVGGDHSESPSPTSLLKQVHLRAHGTEFCLDSSWVSPMSKILQTLWAICSSVWWPESQKFLLMSRWNFQFLPIASCLIPWHHQEEPGSILCHPPFRCW